MNYIETMDDLNFDGHNTQYATHSLHFYAAKCLPQLARYGIENYSQIGDTVLDPMAGIGTTLIEARLLGRNAIGYDIDSLVCIISQVKCRELSDKSKEDAYNAGYFLLTPFIVLPSCGTSWYLSE